MDQKQLEQQVKQLTLDLKDLKQAVAGLNAIVRQLMKDNQHLKAKNESLNFNLTTLNRTTIKRGEL